MKPIALGLLLLIGCFGATGQQLNKRAAFDLSCDESQLKVIEIDARTRGVTGCGKRATYVENCAAPNRQNCTWLLNTSETKRD